MNGPPQKPITAWSGRSSRRTIEIASRMNGTASSGSGTRERVDLGTAADRIGDHRADVLDELDLDAHPEQRQHDVREHHGRVDVVAAHRLERHLGAELRLVADLEERVRLPDLAVFRQANDPPGA